jgi:hypothetical protein
MYPHDGVTPYSPSDDLEGLLKGWLPLPLAAAKICSDLVAAPASYLYVIIYFFHKLNLLI